MQVFIEVNIDIYMFDVPYLLFIKRTIMCIHVNTVNKKKKTGKHPMPYMLPVICNAEKLLEMCVKILDLFPR